MRRIGVVNMKGGVGKTTTAIHLAAGFASRGSRTLLVDADPQGTVGQFLRLRPDRTLSELMTGADAASVIVASGRPNLDAVISTPAAFTLDAQLAGVMQRETVLRRALAGITQIRSLWPEHPLTLAAVVPIGVNLGTHASRAEADYTALVESLAAGPAHTEKPHGQIEKNQAVV